MSNYAALLCYSPVRADELKARQLAFRALDESPSVAAASNLVVVLHMTGRREEAYSYALKLAESLHVRYTGLFEKADTSAEDQEKTNRLFRRIGEIQRFDDTFVYADFTQLLNFALLCAETAPNAEETKTVAENVLGNYGVSSAWARYLAKKMSIDIKKPAPRKPAVVDGITVGSTMDIVLKGWGKPDEIGTDGQGNENWIYRAKQAALQVENGTVMQITLLSDGSPAQSIRYAWGLSKPISKRF